MGQFAYLSPVGPFAGLSNAARQKIAKGFPGLSIAEIEQAAACFLLEQQAANVEPRLTEARHELNIFAKEIARFQAALDALGRHRLQLALGEASRMISGENELEALDRSLRNLKRAIQQTSRVLPLGCPDLASRRLIAALARQLNDAGTPSGPGANDLLSSLVDLIFEDLMVGADARRAVREWHLCEAAEIDLERTTKLLDLVP